MSTIRQQFNLTNIEANLGAVANITRTSTESGFIAASMGVTTTDESISVGDILNPKQVVVTLLSGDAVRIGLDGSAYPFRLTAAGEVAVFPLDVAGLLETSTITTIADTAGSLDGDYFTLQGRSGTWGVWYDVDDNGTSAPAHGMTNALEITSVVTDDTAILVADATAVDMAASSAFSADFTIDHTVGTTLITLTDKYTGTRTDIAAGTSGFTVATPQAGAASPVIHLKSSGTSQVVVAVAPN